MEEEIKPDLAFFYNLDYENNICLDCKGALPCFISINNAIIICRSCALVHTQLGFNVSFVREVNDDWDPYLLSFVQRGGNGRFIRFCNDFNLTDLPITVKYKTKAAEYYRKLILSEVQADSPPEPILMNAALEESFNQIIFPEFDNYVVYKGEEEGKGDNNNTTTKGIIGMINTVTNSDMKDKIVNGSTATIEGIKTASGVIYDYSKPVISFLSTKTVQGLGFLFRQIADSVNEYQNKPFNKEKKGDNNDTTTKGYNSNSGCHTHCNNCNKFHNKKIPLNQFHNENNQKPQIKPIEPVNSQISTKEVMSPLISTISITKDKEQIKEEISQPQLQIEQMNLLINNHHKETKEKTKTNKYRIAPCKEYPTYEVIVRDKRSINNEIENKANQ